MEGEKQRWLDPRAERHDTSSPKKSLVRWVQRAVATRAILSCCNLSHPVHWPSYMNSMTPMIVFLSTPFIPSGQGGRAMNVLKACRACAKQLALRAGTQPMTAPAKATALG